jgi:hypothetical protein
LSCLPAWKRKPCASLRKLICGLNTIHGMYRGFRYDKGLPQPSAPLRELRGLAALARRLARTGNLPLLRARLAVLKRWDADSLASLAFQAALAMGQKHPTLAAKDPKVIAHLDDATPAAIAAYAERASKQLESIVSGGRGGAHNNGPIAEYALVREIGFLFESITGRPPGITFRESDVSVEYGGPSVEFAKIVYESLGTKINSGSSRAFNSIPATGT